MSAADDLDFWAAGHSGWPEFAAELAARRRLASDAWQARALRGYAAAKIGVPLAGVGEWSAIELAVAVEPALVAAVNCASLADASTIVDSRDASAAALARQLGKLRARGRALLAAYPDLRLATPEAGPPRALTLPGDRPPTEIERVAPGTVEGTVEQREALVEAALRGDLDWRLLPQHVVAALLAALEERTRALGKAAGLPAAAAPEDPLDILKGFLTSPEFAVLASSLAAAIEAARAAMAEALDSALAPRQP